MTLDPTPPTAPDIDSSNVSRLITETALSVREAITGFRNAVDASSGIVAPELKETIVSALDQIVQQQVPGNELANAMQLQEIAVKCGEALPTDARELRVRRDQFLVDYSNSGSYISLEVGSQGHPGAIRVGYDVHADAARLDIVAGAQTAELARAAKLTGDVWHGSNGSDKMNVESAILSITRDAQSSFTFSGG